MKPQELINQWCQLELNILDLYCEITKTYRSYEHTDREDLARIKSVRSLCFKLIEVIHNHS